MHRYSWATKQRISILLLYQNWFSWRFPNKVILPVIYRQRGEGHLQWRGTERRKLHSEGEYWVQNCNTGVGTGSLCLNLSFFWLYAKVYYLQEEIGVNCCIRSTSVSFDCPISMNTLQYILKVRVCFFLRSAISLKLLVAKQAASNVSFCIFVFCTNRLRTGTVDLGTDW